MIQVLQGAGMDVVVLGPEASKHGAVETHEEAKRCAALFKGAAGRIDGVIVSLPNFGDERAIADTAALTRISIAAARSGSFSSSTISMLATPAAQVIGSQACERVAK